MGKASIPPVGGTGAASLPLLRRELHSPDRTRQTTNLRRWEETLQGNMRYELSSDSWVCRPG